MTQKLSKYTWIILLFAFSVFMGIVWFHNGLPKATGESGLLFATIGKQFDLTKYAWTDTTIGETPFSFNGSFPLFFVFKVLSGVLSPGIIQAIFFSLMIFLGSLGSGLLSQYFYKNIPQKVIVFIGLAYTFNPYSIVFIWNRFLYNYTLAYTLMPLLFYLWIHYLREGKHRTLIYLFLISFIFSFAFTGLAYLVCFMIAVALITIGTLISYKERKKTLIRTILLGFVLLSSQLFWIFPFYAGNRIGVGQSSSFFSEEGNLHTTIQLSEYYGGIFDKLSQVRADMSALAYDGIPWAQWYSTTLVHAVSLVAIIMSIGGLIVIWYFKVKHRYLIFIGFLLLLLLINGTSAPIGNIYLLMYKIHPTLEVLRNPYEKAGFLLYLVVFIIWGSGIALLYSRFSRLVGNVLLLISCIWWGINAMPIFNGVVFTYKYDVSKNPAIGFSVKVPDYYLDAASYVKTDNFVSRGMALPMTGEGVTHTWEYGYDGVESYNGLFNKAFISLDTTTGQLPQIAQYVRRSQPADILKSLPLLNVSTIVVRHDLLQPSNTSTPSEYSAGLKNALLMDPTVFGNKNLEIFKVSEAYQSPILFLTDEVRLQNKPTFDPENTPKYGATVWSNDATLPADILYPDVTFSEYGVIGESSYTQNQLLTLPHVSVQRDSRFYPLIRAKEYFWKLTHGYEMSAVYSTLSFKRLAEIDHILSTQNRDMLRDGISDYKAATVPLLIEARDKVRESGGNRSFWDLIFKSQEEVLNKYVAASEGDSKTQLESIRSYVLRELHTSNIYPMYSNKLSIPTDYLIDRSVFTVPDKSQYQIEIKGGIPTYKFGDSIQISDQIVNIGRNKYMNAPVMLPLNSAQGKTEIRVPIQEKTQLLSDGELNLGSLSPAIPSLSWKSNAPQGTGDAIISFEYKILKGEGPVVSIFQNDNLSKPVLTQSFPPDTYDFDWKSKTISIPFRYDTNAITVKFDAIPGNDCEKNNPLDIKCTLLSFRQVYDRHTKYSIRNVKITYKPQISVTLIKNTPEVPSLEKTSGTVLWQKLNPAVYKVQIDNLASKSLLVLLNQSHPGWTLYKVNSSQLPNSDSKNWKNYRALEYDGSSSAWEQLTQTLRTIMSRPSEANTTRVTVDGYANGWTVSENGTYLLVFHPQIFLYTGWLITASSFIALAVFISKNRQYGKKHNRK